MNTSKATTQQQAHPITLKKLSISRSLSEETIAYTADVYWLGRLVGHIRNDGCGGCSSLHLANKGSHADLDAAQAFAKTQTQDLGEGFGIVPCDDLEDHVDWLVGEEMERQDAQRWLIRTMKTKTVVLSAGNIYTTGTPWKGDTARIESLIRAKHPDAVILNALPMEEALAHYLSVPAT